MNIPNKIRVGSIDYDNPNCKHEFEPQIKEKYLGAMISETYINVLIVKLSI